MRRYPSRRDQQRGGAGGEEAARRLARAGQHEIGPGLTCAEFTRIEQDYGFEFADDHRAFLAAGLPLNPPGTQERPWHGDGRTGATATPLISASSSAGPSRGRSSTSSTTTSGIPRGAGARLAWLMPWERHGVALPKRPS